MQWRLLAGQSQLAMSKQSCWVLQAVNLKTNTYRHACSSYYWIEKPTTIKMNHLWRHNWNLRILVTDPCWLAWYRCTVHQRSGVLMCCHRLCADTLWLSLCKSQHRRILWNQKQLTMITIHENLYYINIEYCFL